MTAFGLDVGTTGIKGVAVGEDGELVARASAEYPLLTPHPGWAEQEPDAWWEAAVEVLGRLKDEAGEPVGIGLSGQMHGLVSLDSADHPLRPAILWNDGRTAEEVTEIADRIGLDALIEHTGNRALTGFTAPKLLWLRHHEPDVFERIDGILLPKDYIRLRLTGERASDVSDASGTLLFDVGARGWSEWVADELGIPAEWLPPVRESTERTGETVGGLPVKAGVPVAAGAGDQAAGAIGVGVTGAGGTGVGSVVLGTSGVVFSTLERFAPDPQGRTHTFCHAVPGTWHAMGVTLAASGSLRWLRDTVAPGETYGTLDDEAGRVAAGAEGCVFLPYLAGERTPHADPGATGSFTGLTLRHGRGHLVRAVLEGVAFSLRDCLDVLRDAGAELSSGRASGGGAASRLWLQIVASTLEVPIERMGVDEGAAFGAALLGGVTGGVWADVQEAVDASIRVSETIDPNPGWAALYRDELARYRALYPAIRDVTDATEPTRGEP